jgi:hypothetical protein
MNAPARLAAFGLAAVVALGGGAALGAAAGPATTPTVHADHQESPVPSTTLSPTSHAGHGDPPAAAADYRIDAPTTVVAAGQPQRLTFRVLDPAGATVTDFEDRHDRPMHLIVVSNDMGDYAHLHPQLADGTWSVELPALEPGGYRVIADTVPSEGPDLVLTVDLVVPGIATGRPLPDPAGTTVVDDLSVTLDLTPATTGLTAALSVRRDGAVVEPEPYLGARGHLVAIDAEDLGYLHVHPTEGDGPVSFGIAEPAPGRYRLFFDFSVDGQVRTAAFTVDIAADPTTTPTAAPAADHAHTDGEGH